MHHPLQQYFCEIFILYSPQIFLARIFSVKFPRFTLTFLYKTCRVYTCTRVSRSKALHEESLSRTEKISGGSALESARKSLLPYAQITPRIPGIPRRAISHRRCYYTMDHSASLFLISAKACAGARARAIPITPRGNKV